MPPVSRLSDKAKCDADAHGCPACPHTVIGPAISGSPTVMVNHLPALRVSDMGVHAACCGPNMWFTIEGSPTVRIDGLPAVRKGDMTQHCGGVGPMIDGSHNVFADG